MSNQELLQKMRIDMEMQVFSKFTKQTYETASIAKEIHINQICDILRHS